MNLLSGLHSWHPPYQTGSLQSMSGAALPPLAQVFCSPCKRARRLDTCWGESWSPSARMFWVLGGVCGGRHHERRLRRRSGGVGVDGLETEATKAQDDESENEHAHGGSNPLHCDRNNVGETANFGQKLTKTTKFVNNLH